ncbi:MULTISPECIES: Acg family FMN-binding oxidoreductase [unclassified Streptomyces]|uniref:Acg family FMN-binding oxidoreductase n=1 Tax=unclassified Streptomyces TaxID=2593676 RepID=UPI000F6F37D9|nr:MULTISPECIES: nitroreductase family protein [unclassified Streptomyces]AZM63812.1 nitroreductase [Streptomyces sp. WAC 01438]RSM92274.1 nitroreductase [Streptomyces sp. WAC 01420]
MASRPLDDSTVTTLVAEATTAPSMHNAQPWKFRYRSAEHLVLLRADPERAMPHSDPDNRALHIGCGAALFNLRVGAAYADLVTETTLLPEPGDPLLLAAVRLSAPLPHSPADVELARLHPAVRERHTSRHPFSDEDIPDDVRNTLRDAAAQEGAELLFPGPWHTESLLDLIRDAESRDALDPGAAEDVLRWTRLGAEADTAVDGIPDYAFGPRKEDGRAPVRDFAGRRTVAGRGTTAFEDRPHLALLSTRGDGPADWLRAGQALERVLLEATLAGLATSLTSHALEEPALRPLARDPAEGVGQVHMVLRLGYGPPGPATPRRPVREVLEIV